MGRIRDAVETLLRPGWDKHLRARDAEYDELNAELRVMMTECASMLEKMHTWAARQAKRDYRSSARIEHPPESGRSEVQILPVEPAPGTAEWKAYMRRRLAQHGHQEEAG